MAGILLASSHAKAQTVGSTLGSIGVHFVNGGNNVDNGETDSLGTAEVAGAPAYSQSNWNNFGRYGYVSGGSVSTSTGASTSLSINWDSVATYASGSGTGDSNSKLMDGYLDPSYAGSASSAGGNGGDNPNGIGNDGSYGAAGVAGGATANPNTQLTGSNVYNEPGYDKPLVFVGGIQSYLSSVGASSYSIVLYFAGDNGGDTGRVAERWIQSTSDYPYGNSFTQTDITPHLYTQQASPAYTSSSGFVAVDGNATSLATAEVGNYLVFSGLTADTILIRSSEVQDYASDPLNGFQIIANAAPAPEPGSLAVLGVSGVLALRRRRR